MSQAKETVTIRLLDSDYQIACTADERQDLVDSARYLDSKMREIKGNNMIGLDRIAVLAALTISHELLRERRSSTSSTDDLRRLTDKITQALGNQTRLEL